MSRRGLAVSITPLENRREAVVAAAVAADRIGYDGFFVAEAWALDATIVLAEAAVRTERITLGTGILGVWGRSAGHLAMAAATLASLSGGRFVLGLGASTAQLTEGLHDMAFRAPAAKMRQVVAQVRALLRGDRIPLAVATGARPLKLNVPASTVPIYVAALADESIRLAGEVADGWVPFLYPWSQLAVGADLLREGGARDASAAGLPAICPSVPTVVARDAAAAREGAAWFVAFYLTTMGPLYRQSLIRQGFDKEVAAVLAANTPKFAAAVPPEAERLLEHITVYGTPDEACARLERWYGAGAALPSLLLRPNLAPDEIEFTLAAFRPMLQSTGAAYAPGRA